jgi:outer membrane protein assembly factor BamB
MSVAVGAVLGAVVGAIVGGGAPASARPVPIGRYTELPYGVSAAHPYATTGADARRRGRVGVEGPVTAPSLMWETRLRAGRPFSPAVTETGALYVASSDGVARVSSGGQLVWTVRLRATSGTPSLTPTGDIAVGTRAGELVVLSPRGEERVRTMVGGSVRGSPLVRADGSMVVAASDGAVHRFDADGRRIFRAAMPGVVEGVLAWSPRGEILASMEDRLQQVDLRGDLGPLWMIGPPMVVGPALSDDDSIWLVGRDHVVRQYASTGTLRTQTDLGVPLVPTNTLAIGRDGAVRVPTRGDVLVCIGAGGTVRWRVANEGSFIGGVTIDAADRTLALTDAGTLLSVDADGRVLWRVPTQARSDAAPVLGRDGTVYIVTHRGTIQAWSATP